MLPEQTGRDLEILMLLEATVHMAATANIPDDFPARPCAEHQQCSPCFSLFPAANQAPGSETQGRCFVLSSHNNQHLEPLCLVYRATGSAKALRLAQPHSGWSCCPHSSDSTPRKSRNSRNAHGSVTRYGSMRELQMP